MSLTMEPTVGRIVLYKIAPKDLRHFLLGNPTAKLRGAEDSEDLDSLLTLNPAAAENVFVEWRGNPLKVGDEYPMVVVRPWHTPGHYKAGISVLNGHVLLDGPGSLHALSVNEGTIPGNWRWPPRS